MYGSVGRSRRDFLVYRQFSGGQEVYVVLARTSVIGRSVRKAVSNEQLDCFL